MPKKDHNLPGVLEAKRKEIENLENYKVFEKVEEAPEGVKLIGTRWVHTKSEDHDGQKEEYKSISIQFFV